MNTEDILLIHSMVLDETGGSHGIREHHALLSLEHSPRQAAFGQELYPTLFLKAAVYAHSIIMYHPFLDGNKRTGMTSSFIFLENNGYGATAAEGEIEKFALEIVRGRLDIRVIAVWFEQHSSPLKK